ncbi:MAG TPA: ferrous iron transport protein A [Firmicutes bacterium]|nr:ferrous iron transport protein A [Bacillota bacterium]
MDTTQPMSQLKEGQDAVVTCLELDGAIRRRLIDLGLMENTPVRCLQKSPWGDPAAYWIRGAVIALRREDSSRILVRPLPGEGGDQPWD